ncbi:MAG: bifunctional adenosylcobinamide kinase/adenosylcobinamide-phosphate guanylyltransferase [Spongiibacteraceae bacterium]|nr:bifunctional adenosylcobinamide kinase/adenosylcobinamide-phosphate guanylyltransferase [Spongiibacteraceae bacterium]
MLELYLGGARSGKSGLAEAQAEYQATIDAKQLVYIATATAGDDEMSARIKLHQHRRSQTCQWRTVEEPLALADTLIALDDEKNCIVVDCLTLWISNLMLDSSLDKLSQERQALLDCMNSLKSHIIFVSNEVGQGIVPVNDLARRFIDESGFLHQQLARQCDRVVFTIAGLPQLLKGAPFQESVLERSCVIGSPT